NEQADTYGQGLDASTRLAVERTRLALDRTLMAWIRSAISLITFGYGIYKVIETRALGSSPRIGHHEFGLIMISVGLLALALGTYEHQRAGQQLGAEYPAAPRRPSCVRAFSALVGALGLLAFLTMILRP
ncbi:MAG: DUF202 domain-containing protein, partial [Verrucomicrobia bacterium]|nr:DUF202 domain-containing protein [Verrucomicrobiota bacterium]